MTPERRIACRKQVAALLNAVLEEIISARDAINCWPAFCNEDSSVQCAYTMLWYWEADEDRRWQEMMYSDVQLQQLSDVAKILNLGLPLPDSLKTEYLTEIRPNEFSEKTMFSRPLLTTRHFLGWIKFQLLQSFSLLGLPSRTLPSVQLPKKQFSLNPNPSSKSLQYQSFQPFKR